MSRLSRSIVSILRLLLAAALLHIPVHAQQQEADVSTLSADDQAIVKGLRFRAADAAPQDTRTATFIKARLPVVNTGPQPSVAGKLSAEVRMLFRTHDKAWYVLRCRQDFVIARKGAEEVYISFSETNKQIEGITGDKASHVEDSVTIVRYAGVKIFESEPSKASRFPDSWWLKTGRLSDKDTAPAAALPAKVADTSTGELKILRSATERALRAQIWKTYEQSVAALNDRYLAAIDKALKTAQSQGQLDEALALRSEKDTVVKTGRPSRQTVPAQAPSLASLRSTYESALMSLQAARAKASLPVMEDYNQKAEQIITRLIKDGKLDEAKSARDSKDIPIITED